MVDNHSTSDDSSVKSTKEVQPVIDQEDENERISPDPEKGDAVPISLPNDPNDWNGPDDPQNPMNWPRVKKYAHVVSPALMGFVA